MSSQTLHLIFRNILLEERQDVRDLSIQAWNQAIRLVDNSGLYAKCIEPFIQEWFNLALIPRIDGYTPLAFAKADIGSRKSIDAHDVDKAMMTSDFSLVDENRVLRNRLDAIVALAQIARLGHADVSDLWNSVVARREAYWGPTFEQMTFTTLLSSFLMSTSAHQLTLCGVFLQEWAQASEGERTRFIDRLPDTAQVISALANLTERQPPEAYYEAMQDLASIKQETKTIRSLVESTRNTGKSIERNPQEAEKTSLAEVRHFLTSTFDDLLQKSPKRLAMRQQLADRKTGLETALLQYERSNSKLDSQVTTSAAAALIWMKVTPSRLNPIIQNVMKGIKVGQFNSSVDDCF